MLMFSIRNLRSRPVRSLLALCGLTVAIMGMVGLFSVAAGITATVDSTFSRIPGLVVMQPGAPIPLLSRLPSAWQSELTELPGVHVVCAEVWARAHIIEGRPIVSPPRLLFGMDIPRVLQLRHSVYGSALKQGRFLTLDDRGTWNAVVSRPIAEEFHKSLGDTLRVDGQTLTIVGIYECQSLLLDVNILCDIDRIRLLARMGRDSVCSFYVEPRQFDQRQALLGQIKQHFRGRSLTAWQPLPAFVNPPDTGRASPAAGFVNVLQMLAERLATAPQGDGNRAPDGATAGGNDAGGRTGTADGGDTTIQGGSNSARGAGGPAAGTSQADQAQELPIEVRSSDEWAGEFKRFSADLDVLLVLLTSIGVTVAVLGIINTMLMSVSERIIEIGVLKANGWSNENVLLLIASESGVLGFAGGVLGALLGWGATHVFNSLYPTRVHLYASPELLLFSLAFSTGLGLLGGLYPAIWAARLLPMEAIRRG